MLFKDVLVDQALKQQLINLIKEKRISHAQLFLGQAGSHTFALAVAYAQYLCCENRGENDSCGVCPSCIKFEKLSHPDFHLIFPNCITKSVKKDPDSKQFSQEFKDFVLEHQYHLDIHDWLDHLGGENKQASINIRDCANIINQNSIRSYEGGYKIYILWMVERLYHAAAPKLLKTLEEPENKTLFILIAESSDKILSTILSRTQLIKLPRLSVETIQKQLVSDFNISSDTAHDIAEISEGNYHKAITLYQNNSDMKEMLRHFELMFSSMVALAQNASNEQVRFLEVENSFAEIISKGREAQKNYITFITRMLRNILLLNTHHENIIRATSEEKRLLNFFKTLITLKNISSIIEECNKALFHIERNGNSALIFTDLYLKISQHLAPRT